MENKKGDPRVQTLGRGEEAGKTQTEKMKQCSQESLQALGGGRTGHR